MLSTEANMWLRNLSCRSKLRGLEFDSRKFSVQNSNLEQPIRSARVDLPQQKTFILYNNKFYLLKLKVKFKNININLQGKEGKYFT